MANNNIGSQRVAGNRRHGLGWLPWVALLALLLLAGLVYLLLQNVNDNNDAPGVDTSDDEVAMTSTTLAASAGATATTVTSGNNVAGKSASLGQLKTAGGSDVFGAVANNASASLIGQPVTATGVAVNSVVANEGFWVGDTANQVFVHLTEAARGTGESGAQVKVGQKVDFAGTLTKVPSDPGTLGVTAAEGAKQLVDEGAYVNATSFRIN